MVGGVLSCYTYIHTNRLEYHRVPVALPRSFELPKMNFIFAYNRINFNIFFCVKRDSCTIFFLKKKNIKKNVNIKEINNKSGFKSDVCFFGVFTSHLSFKDHPEKQGERCVKSQFYTTEESLLS